TPDLGPGPVLPLSWLHRAGECLRRSDARRQSRLGLGAGRGGQPADHKILGRLVEHVAPAGESGAARGTDDRAADVVAVAGDGIGLHAVVRDPLAAAHADPIDRAQGADDTVEHRPDAGLPGAARARNAAAIRRASGGARRRAVMRAIDAYLA